MSPQDGPGPSLRVQWEPPLPLCCVCVVTCLPPAARAPPPGHKPLQRASSQDTEADAAPPAPHAQPCPAPTCHPISLQPLPGPRSRASPCSWGVRSVGGYTRGLVHRGGGGSGWSHSLGHEASCPAGRTGAHTDGTALPTQTQDGAALLPNVYSDPEQVTSDTQLPRAHGSPACTVTLLPSSSQGRELGCPGQGWAPPGLAGHHVLLTVPGPGPREASG